MGTIYIKSDDLFFNSYDKRYPFLGEVNVENMKRLKELSKTNKIILGTDRSGKLLDDELQRYYNEGIKDIEVYAPKYHDSIDFRIRNKEELDKLMPPSNVDHPAHYTDGSIEVIDFIEDKKLSYHLGNAVKYISRAGKKDKSKYVEDLQKAIWYLQREVERYESNK